MAVQCWIHSSFATEHFQRKPFEIYYTENERRDRKDDYGALYRLGHVRLATHAQYNIRTTHVMKKGLLKEIRNITNTFFMSAS